ncbi:MAG: DNA-binding response regulator [Gammaproteobacteria bacterium]|nr:MAG: DNA-binding response regulator [Gammaproteobacteria bacterium]
MSDKIRVLLVDDHAMLRKGMVLLLSEEDDVEVIGEASDGEQAIEQARVLKPDVVVMDISMPKLNGVEATREIIAESPASKIIALSIHSAKHVVDDMLSAGAVGYVLKESVPEELLQGIRSVMRGDMYLSDAITGTVVSAYVEGMSGDRIGTEVDASRTITGSKLSILEQLTNREQDIVELLAQRMRNKEMATRLFISPETVKSHLKHVYQKLGVGNRREAAIKAAEIMAALER